MFIHDSHIMCEETTMKPDGGKNMKNVFLINFHCGSMFLWSSVVKRDGENTNGFNLINFVQHPMEEKQLDVNRQRSDVKINGSLHFKEIKLTFM